MDDEAPSQAHVRNARHAYYGSISYIDDKVGELMRTVEQCGFAGNTIVLLTSDHGEFLGERDLWFKRSFFEESVRVPFVAYAPWRWQPRRVAQACSLMDLFPTLATLAGGACADDALSNGLHGHCIAPLFDGDRDPQDVFAELTAEATPAPLLMVRRGSFKYVHCELDEPQLYDLGADPLEQRNLAQASAQRATLDRLHAAVVARWDLQSLGGKVRESQRRRKALAASLNRGQTQPWDYSPPSDAYTAYYRNSLAFDPARLFDIALRYGAVELHAGSYRSGAHELGTSRADAIRSLAADLDLANAIVRSVEEAKSFLR